MLTDSEIDQLEKLIGQLDSLHSEVSALARKSPNDAVNAFKIKFINAALSLGNELFGDKYRPFDDFEQFDSDDMPSNSDVTLIVSQYMQAAEKLRSDSIIEHHGEWYYATEHGTPSVKTSPPAKLKR